MNNFQNILENVLEEQKPSEANMLDLDKQFMKDLIRLAKKHDMSSTKFDDFLKKSLRDKDLISKASALGKKELK